MSAAGRGAKRNEADFYPTPAACTISILRAVALPGGAWLEPSAGEGAIIRTVNAIRSDVEWTACELRGACAPGLRTVGAVPVIGDFIASPPPGRFDVAILNPPFSMALDFIRHCLDCAGWVVALERLNFLGPVGRNRFWREHMPDIYVLATRPSFTGTGTDMTEYAWFVWPPDGHDRSAGRIEVLPASPDQEELAGMMKPLDIAAMKVHRPIIAPRPMTEQLGLEARGLKSER